MTVHPHSLDSTCGTSDQAQSIHSLRPLNCWRFCTRSLRSLYLFVCLRLVSTITLFSSFFGHASGVSPPSHCRGTHSKPCFRFQHQPRAVFKQVDAADFSIIFFRSLLLFCTRLAQPQIRQILNGSAQFLRSYTRAKLYIRLTLDFHNSLVPFSV